MSIEYPWPEAPEDVERRVLGIVQSLLDADEFRELRLDWVTPAESPPGFTSPGGVVLRVTVYAKDEEVFQNEFWEPDYALDWEGSLQHLASGLEDWVCETAFAWGQQRVATVPS